MSARVEVLLEQILVELVRMQKSGQSSAPTPSEVAAARADCMVRQYETEKTRLSEPVESHQIDTIDSGATLSPVQGSAQGGSLRLTVERYLSSLVAMTWTPQHHKAVEYTLLNFVSWRGQGTTGQLGTITKQVIRDYREAAQKALAPKTVNNHLAIISSFFSWAIDQGVCSLNPAKDLALKVKTRRSSQRKAFSGQQIQEVMGTISASVWYTKKLRDWIPLIMLYTGARPEEIAQLRRKDIRMAGDWDNGSRLWLFDFETEENGQRRKSEASRRLVPVHPKLIERGLINLLQGTEGSPDSLIWPQEGGNERGRLSENASRWFNRTWLRSHCGITDPKLVLYSIRHSVATRLKHRGVDECMIAQLLGHEHPEITNGRYGKDYPIKQLAEALTHLEWFV